MRYLEIIERLLMVKVDVYAKASENFGWTGLLTVVKERYSKVLKKPLIIKTNVNAEANYCSSWTDP